MRLTKFDPNTFPDPPRTIIAGGGDIAAKGLDGEQFQVSNKYQIA